MVQFGRILQVRVPLPPNYLINLPCTILNNFSQKYRTGAIASSKQQVQYCTVDNALRLNDQVPDAIGGRYPCLTIKRELHIRLFFHFWSYTNQYPHQVD